MFWPVLGISAAAISLTQLGALAVKVAVLKSMLAVTAAIAVLLALVLMGQRRNARPS